MERKRVLLTDLSYNKRARVVGIHGGQGFQRRLRTMGIREGQVVTIVSRQPFRGPVTVSIGGCQMTLGRGMAHKIIVEEA